jgi:hypothetical protein
MTSVPSDQGVSGPAGKDLDAGNLVRDKGGMSVDGGDPARIARDR